MILGLHPLDFAIVIASLLGTIFLGWWVSRGKKKQSEGDFLVAGKKMGGVLQFFLNFGSMADSNGAPTVAAEVFRQGVGGIWINFQLLFATPFYWFFPVWFRRSRQITFADLFVDRFDGRRLAFSYALINVVILLVLMGMGNIISYKVSAAMIVKPPSAYTAAERESVEGFKQYQALQAKLSAETISNEERVRLQTLDNLRKRGQLLSYVSYIRPIHFYVGYTAIVTFYIMLGGLKAAAIIDAFQGILIVIFSVMLIPIGLGRVGGFRGLHAKVADCNFELFGSVATSDYTWYSILAIFPGGLSDTENTWGALAHTLLAPGFMGLMISGMVLGHMPAVGVSAVNLSALITRNIYEPLLRGRSEAHYLFVAKATIPIVLALSIVVTTQLPGAVAVLSFLITFGAYMGTAGFLTYFWRKLTVQAIAIGMVFWILLMGIPWMIPNSVRRSPSMMLEGKGRVTDYIGTATADEVKRGLAAREGDSMKRTRVQPNPALFFESIARIDPRDPGSPVEGLGRFNLECYLLSCSGVPVARFNSADLLACRWLFDGLFPFVILVGLSYLPMDRLWRRSPRAWNRLVCEQQARNERFFVKMKTQVKGDLDEDARELEVSYANPQRFDHEKLFPRSQWEFLKWRREDAVGFTVCWLLVVAIVGLLWGVVRLGGGW